MNIDDDEMRIAKIACKLHGDRPADIDADALMCDECGRVVCEVCAERTWGVHCEECYSRKLAEYDAEYETEYRDWLDERRQVQADDEEWERANQQKWR